LCVLMLPLLGGCSPSKANCCNQVKAESRFTDQFKIGYIEIDWDQELSVYKGIPVCPNWCSGDFDCPSCDFTDPDVCAGVYEIYHYNTSSGHTITCTCPSAYCDYTPLQNDEWVQLNRTIRAGAQYWRIDRPDGPGCDASVFRFQALTTLTTAFYATNPWYTRIGSIRPRGNRYMSMCPWWNFPGINHELSMWFVGDGPHPAMGIAEFVATTRPVTNTPRYLEDGDSTPFDNCASGSITSYNPLYDGDATWGPDWPINDQHICFPMGEIYYWGLQAFGNDVPPSTLVRLVIPLKTGPGCQTYHVGLYGRSFWDIHFSYTNPWVYANQTSDLHEAQAFYWNPDPGQDPRDGNIYFADEWLQSVCFNDTEQHYLYVSFSTNRLFGFWVDDTLDWMDSIPFTNISQYAFPHDFLNGYTLDCAGKKFTNSHETVQAHAPWDEGILNTRMLYPTEEPNYFYPPPDAFSGDARYALPVIDNPPPMKTKRTVIGVILDWRLNSQSSFQEGTGNWMPMSHQFLTEEEFAQCKVTFHGKFGNNNWEPYAGTVPKNIFLETYPRCEPDLFDTAKEAIEANLEGLVEGTVTGIEGVLGVAAATDVLANSKDYAFCKDLFSSFVIPSSTQSGRTVVAATQTCAYDFGTRGFAEDPCCNFTYDYLSTCSAVERDFPITDLESRQMDFCREPICAQRTVESFGDELGRVTRPDGCSQKVPLLGQFIADASAPYFKCRNQFIYYYSNFGFGCTHDDDCTQGENGICSWLYSGAEGEPGQCLFNLDKQIDAFLECFFESMPGSTQIGTMKALGATGPTVAAFREASVIDGCIDPAGYLIAASQRQIQVTAACLPGCFFDNYLIVDSSELAWPTSCDCGPSQAPLSIPDQCVYQQCNYDYTLTPAECGTGNICALCEYGVECQDYTNFTGTPFTSITCGQEVLCRLNDGTELMVDSNETCLGMMSCDRLCDGDICLTQEDCENENITGYCSDSDWMFGLYSPNYPFPQFSFEGYGGACLAQYAYALPSTQTPQCYGTIFQNIHPETCILPVNSTTCNIENYTKFITRVTNGNVHVTSTQWFRKGTTKDLCENEWPYLCRGVAGGTDGILDDNVLGLTPEECEIKGGQYTPFWNWKKGHWRGGQPRQLVWTPITYGYRFEEAPMFDFFQMTDAVLEAINSDYGLLLQSALYCQYGTSTQQLNELVCNCIEGQLDCATVPGTADIASLCGFIPATISSPPFDLEFSDMSSNQFGTCVTLLLSKRTILEYKDKQKPALSNALVTYQEDVIWAAGRNSKRAIWGKVLTDGLDINWNSTEDRYRDVIFVADLHPERLDFAADTLFPVLDIAYKIGEGELTPLGTSVNRTQYGFIGHLNEILPNATYYFVQIREGDWQLVNRYIFETGEIVYLSFILAFYCIGLIGSFYKVCKSIYVNGLVLQRLFFIIMVIFTFFVFRVVLFAMVLGNGLVDTTSPAPNYVLVEFPVILYFIFVSNYIVLWVMIRRKTKQVRQSVNMVQTANTLIIATNLFVFFMFILCIILYETIVADPVTICAGQVVVFDEQTAFIILMVYRAIFSTIEIIFGVCLFVSGFLFASLLKKMSTVPNSLVYRTQFVSIVGSLGLIMQGIYLLIIVATKTEQVLYLSLSILIIVEIIPALVFLSMCEIKPISGEQTRSKTKSETHPEKKKSDDIVVNFVTKPASNLSRNGSKTVVNSGTTNVD